jgi:uncharacterized protein (TIGR02246 family)
MEIMSTEKAKEGQMELREVARKNFDLWNATLQTKSPQEVAKLYAGDSTFLPTVSGEFKKGPEEAEGYFKHFLEKDPKGEVKEEEVQDLGEGIYLHSGMYDFELGQNGNRSVVQARFSFVWRREASGDWKIIHHHSSVKPQS